MSTISKLEIRGIRSFGVESEDVQKIKFQSPLTLIVGQNGCGKTTIIECLKYGLTGEVPPGTDRGKAFVHDPKIFNTVESLGQVKLMVKDITGNRVTATRSMKVSHKGNTKQAKFETLDSVVTMENVATGQKTNISRPRVADINNDMCDAMGVSKAIINNVIFCHQEDSNWPLEEPKELKKKFDAIFGTTEYNRVIEKLIKISKEYGDRQKEKAGDLKLLENIKNQAELKQVQLEKAEQKKEDKRGVIESLDGSLKPIFDRLEQIAKIERDFSKLKQQEIEYTSKINTKEEQQKQLRSKIRTLFTGSLSELEVEIRTFQQSMDSKRSELHDTECDLALRKGQEKVLQNKSRDLETQRVQLISKRQQEQELNGDRAKKVEELCVRMKLPTGGDYETDSLALEGAVKAIKHGIRSEESELQAMIRSHDEADQKAQRAVDKLREEKAKLEADFRQKGQLVADFAREKAQTQSEIAVIERSAEMLKKLVSDIEKLEQEYENQKANSNIDGMRQQLVGKKNKREELQSQLDRVEEQIFALDAVATKATELGLKEQQMNGKEAEFRRVRSKHSDNLKRLFPSRTIEANYKRNVQDLYDDLQRQIKQLNESTRRSQATVTEMETTRRSQKRDLERMEKEFAENKEKIYAACQGNSYEDVLAKLKEKITKNNLEHGELRSAEVLYKKYISRIEDDRCCPVCHKDMAGSDVQDISAELSDEIRRLPEKIESLERQLKSDQVKYDRLLALQPYSERVEKQTTEIPKLKELLQETERRLMQASADLEEYQMSIIEPNSSVQLINSILGDMSILDESAKDLERMKKGIAELKQELAERMPQGSNSSLEDLKLEREAVRAELRNERNAVDALQTKIDEETERLNGLHQRYNQMKEKKIKLQESIQSLDQKKAKEVELGAKIIACQKEMDEAERKLGPVRQNLTKEEDTKNKTKEENRVKVNKAQISLEQLKRMDGEIGRLGKELEALEKLNLADEIQKLKRKLQETSEDMKKINKSIDETSAQIDALKKEISNQDMLERDFLDNRDLKKLTAETEVLQDKLSTLMRSIGDLDAPNISKERNKLLEQRDAIQAKKSEITGQMAELENQARALKKELERSEFKHAVQNYLKTFSESVVLRKLISDILKYRNALEWALMKYHTEKMEQINRSISALWRDIYRGNDIDCISIKTEDESKAESKTVEKRRVYNYRVVQAKNGVEIDMRGRCSAGQKVLASLIIRMALAETFSNNCGVMALDEPTTNLDRENIGSLCESLRSIVSERESGNFLLIIITHDEEFVTKLEKFDTYYRISRDHNGKSVIKEEQL